MSLPALTLCTLAVVLTFMGLAALVDALRMRRFPHWRAHHLGNAALIFFIDAVILIGAWGVLHPPTT